MLKAWLEALDCGQFFDRFVQAGYDFSFTAKVSDSDHRRPSTSDLGAERPGLGGWASRRACPYPHP